MNYTESSAFQTKSGQSLFGKYVADSVSSYPWGPNVHQQQGRAVPEFVIVDLLDAYVILEIGMFQPVYEGTELASPESVSIMSALIQNKWFEYKDKMGNLVRLLTFLET